MPWRLPRPPAGRAPHRRSRRALAPLLAAALSVPVALGLPAASRAERMGAAPPAGPDPATLCRPAIRGAEARAGIPPMLLAAIGRVESGRRGDDGRVSPWPWTINAEGEGHFYDTKAEAIAAVRALQAQGVRSIDVGCMQVNLMHHPDAFASLDQAFDPAANAAYAARFLTELHGQFASWPKAAAAYHSQTPALGDDYAKQVLAAWPEEREGGGLPGLPALAMAAPMRPGGGLGPMILPGTGHARLLMLPASGGPGGAPGGETSGGGPAGPVGRGLAAYRSAPVMLATRMPLRTGS